MTIKFDKIDNAPRVPFNPSQPASVALWSKWYEQIPNILDLLKSMDLSDLEKRPHSDLQEILQADVTSSSTTGGKHVTNALVKTFEDHRNDVLVHHTFEQIEDHISTFIAVEDGISVAYDDENNSLTFSLTPIEDIIIPTFDNSWAIYNSYSTGYYKDHLGLVRLTGTISSGTVDSKAFTLPEGYRPKSNSHFIVASNYDVGMVAVGSNGEVIPISPSSNVWVDLNNICFRT